MEQVNGNRRTLYLHFGVHRTATTAIQATMFANRDTLRRSGFLHALGVKRHIGLFNSIFAGKQSVAHVAETLPYFLAGFHGQPGTVPLDRL